LIEKIKSGHDPHDATSEQTGLTRSAAKTLNFGILYGMGLEKLAAAIGCTKGEAREFKWQYFDQLPKVKNFIRSVQDKWLQTKVIYNWLGRRYDLDDDRWAGCADIVKKAMVELYAELCAYSSRMVLQVHDEVLFEVHYSEVDVVDKLVDTMEKAYKARHLPLTTSLAYSFKSFGDMIEVESTDALKKAVGKELSSKGNSGVKNTSEHMVFHSRYYRVCEWVLCRNGTETLRPG
jgi:DNA polymerase-1